LRLKTGRRTEYEIYWEILSFCKPGRTFTQIVGRCDLNSKIAQEYIEFLSSKGYLAKVPEGERNLYKTTVGAGEFMSLFTKIYQELFDNSPEFKL
jgi:predicted transcriptional regulator